MNLVIKGNPLKRRSEEVGILEEKRKKKNEINDC